MAGRSDDGAAVDVDAQAGTEVPEGGEVTLEELLKGVLLGAEPFDGDRHRDEDQPADGPLDGEQPEDRGVPQRLAPEHLRGLVGRAPGPGRTDNEIAAAEAPPGLAGRSLDPQPGRQGAVGLAGGRVGLVTPPAACSQLPLVVRPPGPCCHGRG